MEFKTAGAQFFIIDDVLFKDFGGLKELSTDFKFMGHRTFTSHLYMPLPEFQEKIFLGFRVLNF